MTDEAKEARRIYERLKRSGRTPEQKARDAEKAKDYQRKRREEIRERLKEEQGQSVTDPDA